MAVNREELVEDLAGILAEADGEEHEREESPPASQDPGQPPEEGDESEQDETPPTDEDKDGEPDESAEEEDSETDSDEEEEVHITDFTEFAEALKERGDVEDVSDLYGLEVSVTVDPDHPQSSQRTRTTFTPPRPAATKR